MRLPPLITIIKFIVAIGVCQLAGFVGSIFTTPSIPTWYAALRKPAFNPPNWIFGPVWTSLFVLMGIAAFIVWNKGLDRKGVKAALLLFIIQLVLNMLWSYLFFTLHSPLYAFVEIIILWLAILLTMVKFFPISRAAGYLLLPYILWVSFAAVLNFTLFRLNP